jgi:hypothetical protein
MNTTTATPTTDSQISNTEKKAFFSASLLDKKKPIKNLSMRPTRSVKKNTSLMPHPLKTK